MSERFRPDQGKSDKAFERGKGKKSAGGRTRKPRADEDSGQDWKKDAHGDNDREFVVKPSRAKRVTKGGTQKSKAHWTVPPAQLSAESVRELTPDDLREIVDEHGVPRPSIARALAAFGYRNPRFMLQKDPDGTSREVIEVTRTTSKDKGTTFAFSPDTLRAFLQKRIDAANLKREEISGEETIELPGKAEPQRDEAEFHIADEEVFDVTGGKRVDTTKSVDFHVEQPSSDDEGEGEITPEVAENSIEDYFADPDDGNMEDTLERIGEHTLDHEPPDPDEHVERADDTLGTWDTLAGRFVNDEVTATQGENVERVSGSETKLQDINEIAAQLELDILEKRGDQYKVRGGMFGTKSTTVTEEELRTMVESFKHEAEPEPTPNTSSLAIDSEVSKIFDTTDEVEKPAMPSEEAPRELTEQDLYERFVKPRLDREKEEVATPVATAEPNAQESAVEATPNAPLVLKPSKVEGPTRGSIRAVYANRDFYEGLATHPDSVMREIGHGFAEFFEKHNYFDTRFLEQFGINKVQLEKIEEYKFLSQGQRKLVFENLRDFADNEKAKQRTFVGRVFRSWIGISDAEPSITGTGFATYEGFLRHTIKNIALHGPRVHEEGGELVPDLVNIEFDRAHRKEQWEAALELNRAAHALAKTPRAWLDGGPSVYKEEGKFARFVKSKFSPARKRYEEYETVRKAYDAAKRKLSTVLVASGAEQGEVEQHIIALDGRVAQLQYVQTDPDAMEAINSINDPQVVRSLGESLREKAEYFALGYAAKSIIAEVPNWFAGPAYAAALASVRSWNKSEALIRERDRQARKGEKDTSDEAANIVAAESIKVVGESEYDQGLSGKLERLVAEYYERHEADDQVGKEKLLGRIRNRITYTEDKIRLNRVSFGDPSEAPVRVARLYEALATAKIIAAVEPESGTGPQKNYGIPLEPRIAKYLSAKNDAISNKRAVFKAKKIAKQAFIAGGISFAGGLVAMYQDEIGEAVSSAVDRVREFMGGAAEGAGTLIPSGIPEELMPKLDGFDALTQDSGGTVLTEAMNSVEDVKDVAKEYVIQKNDTLWNILRTQIPEIHDMSSLRAQKNAIATIIEKLSPSELKAIGLEDVNKLRAGETLNLGKLREIVDTEWSALERAERLFGKK